MGFDNFGEQSRRMRSALAATGQPLNDAAAYGAQIEAVAPPPGTLYWRALGIYHLTPEENQGRHHAFVEALDESGARIQNPALRLAWSWEGRDPATQPAPAFALDKPASEPAANVPIESGMILRLWIDGDGPSDAVTHLSTDHPDEPAPGGELWNSKGHHSYFVTFQRVRQGTPSKPAPVTVPVTVPVTGPVAGPVTGPGPVVTPAPGAGGFRFEAWPARQKGITQLFGARPEVYKEFGLAGHEGIDIAADIGDPVFSVAAGSVHFVQPFDDGKPYGIQVRIDHAGGFQSIYAHLSQALVNEGDAVTAGQRIGLSGDTGNTEGPHLHLTLKKEGAQTPGYTPGIVDPMPFLRALIEIAPLPAAPVAPAPAGRRVRLRDKIGLDANRPFDPATGALSPQVRDPEVIAASGAGWVRLNFILGERWSSPTDAALSDEGRTWEQSYRTLIDGFAARGLQVYGLISDEALRSGFGDDFRDDPGGARSHPWIDAYVGAFRTIVQMFHRQVSVYESFNEPDDWHGQGRNWVHPGWFAILLDQLYRTIKGDADLRHVTLVSGPLQGLVQGNGARDYLERTYRFGVDNLGWGKSSPFPFDGIGYHLYVNQGMQGDLVQQRQDISSTLAAYLGEMQEVVRRYEGRPRPFYISECGWTSNDDNDTALAFQADSMNTGIEWLARRDDVALAVYFCTQDFTDGRGRQWYGLYRESGVGEGSRKRAFGVFQDLCRREIESGAIAPAGPAVGERPLQGSGRVTALALNLRAGPGQGYGILAELPEGSPLTLLGAAGDWLRVRANGQEGFVFASFVDAVAAAAPEPAAALEAAGAPPATPLPEGIAPSGSGTLEIAIPGLQPAQPAGAAPAQPDKELMKIWREHIAQGFKNNNIMFQRVLNGFMVPYWITVALYAIMVLMGLGLFLLGVWLATAGNQAVAGIISCGLGVAALLAFFITYPLRALERNLQFITWLGLIYNTYWTRLAVANNIATVDADVSQATKDAIAQIEELQAKHVELNKVNPLTGRPLK